MVKNASEGCDSLPNSLGVRQALHRTWIKKKIADMIITVKFLGPTNTKGSRFKATLNGDGVSVTVPRDYSLSNTEAAFAAVKALMPKIGAGSTGAPKPEPTKFYYQYLGDTWVFMTPGHYMMCEA